MDAMWTCHVKRVVPRDKIQRESSPSSWVLQLRLSLFQLIVLVLRLATLSCFWLITAAVTKWVNATCISPIPQKNKVSIFLVNLWGQLSDLGTSYLPILQHTSNRCTGPLLCSHSLARLRKTLWLDLKKKNFSYERTYVMWGQYSAWSRSYRCIF